MAALFTMAPEIDSTASIPAGQGDPPPNIVPPECPECPKSPQI